MTWNKWKYLSIYKSGNFEIRNIGYLWEVYYYDKYIGSRNTLKDAKEVAEHYIKKNGGIKNDSL